MITAEDILKQNNRDIISVDENETVHHCISVMIENKIGAVSVTRNGITKGIWSERDLLRNIMDPDFDMMHSTIGQFMSTQICMLESTATLTELLDKFLGLCIRHVFVKKNDTVIGIISSGDVMKAQLNEKTNEVKDLTSYVSLEYYENWKWQKK